MCSLQSPTLDEFIVYKLAQALAAPAYTDKCIRVPSTGEAREYQPQTADCPACPQWPELDNI